MTEGDRGFAVGERVMLLDSKRRRYLVELVADGEFHSHAGYVAHSSIIGSAEGTVVESTKGAEYVVLRPTLEDFVLEMPRGAQVIYPKDLAPILMLADIAPGVRVFESGLGSGALSTAMLRAGAEVTGYEVREDFANRARINVRSFLGEGALERYHVSVADSYAGIDESLGPFDRVVLDLPEPWQVVPHAERVLRPGGILLAYTPSITQASQTRESLRGRGGQTTLDLEEALLEDAHSGRVRSRCGSGSRCGHVRLWIRFRLHRTPPIPTLHRAAERVPRSILRPRHRPVRMIGPSIGPPQGAPTT